MHGLCNFSSICLLTLALPAVVKTHQVFVSSAASFRSKGRDTSALERPALQQSATIDQIQLNYLNSLITATPESVIGLLRSDVFNKALARFLQGSHFLEELLLHSDWLTKALCGIQAASDIKYGWKGIRVPAGTKNLRIYQMNCDAKCEANLKTVKQNVKELLEKAGMNYSVANYGLDMGNLLGSNEMVCLFLTELAGAPGLFLGLTPKRLQYAFGQLQIRASPELGGHRVKTMSIYIRGMRYKKEWRNKSSEELWQAAKERRTRRGQGETNWISKGIDTIGDSLVPFLFRTLTGFINDLIRENLVRCSSFVDLLNAVFEPLKMDLWAVVAKIGYNSASCDLQFKPEADEPKKTTGWGHFGTEACPRW